jgi:hypothetical protein
MVTVHASVPSTLVYSTADLSRIPVYLVVQDNTNYSVLDSWYICDFCYSTRKRLSNQMGSLDTKRQRSEGEAKSFTPLFSIVLFDIY